MHLSSIIGPSTPCWLHSFLSRVFEDIGLGKMLFICMQIH